ncbi:MAG: Rieske 2Fe-2S domain-containing protein [Isosphaeraceae bacterium]|nr:Rieske 2Fe-2S domain-containing protein [Isosphaeraceae bacterium]
MNRRDLYRYATLSLGGLMSLALVVPGVAYLFEPLRRKSKSGEFRELARLSELPVGVPRSFPIVDERQDAWVKYPKEPIGTVWLVRQPEGSQPAVLAFTAECPHLGCAINLAADAKSFFCPCHTSAFDFQGHRLNDIPPRGMDTLEVAPLEGDDPVIRVKFERFQSQSEEKKRLV